MEINGRIYPLWEQLVNKQEKFIGGELQDFGDSMDKAWGITGKDGMKTTITSIELHPNGTDSAYFVVNGKDFDCGFDVHHGGITKGEEGWLTFNGYMGHTWRIKKAELHEV